MIWPFSLSLHVLPLSSAFWSVLLFRFSISRPTSSSFPRSLTSPFQYGDLCSYLYNNVCVCSVCQPMYVCMYVWVYLYMCVGDAYICLPASLSLGFHFQFFVNFSVSLFSTRLYNFCRSAFRSGCLPVPCKYYYYPEYLSLHH